MYAYKLAQLLSYRPVEGPRGKIGIPMGLNMYELLPFWYTLFTKLALRLSPLLCRAASCIWKGKAPSPVIPSVSLPS